MDRTRISVSRSHGGATIQMSLAGLILTCVGLVVASALLTYGILGLPIESRADQGSPSPTYDKPGAHADAAPKHVPAWGEFHSTDILLERPEEYAGFEIDTNQPPAWVFAGMTPDQVRSLMSTCGLTPGQIGRALSPPAITVTASNTVVHPDDELVLSLSPEARASLYGRLAKDAANHYMWVPFCYPGRSFDSLFDKSKVDPAIVALIKKLLYLRGDARCFSDYEMVLQRVPSEEARLDLAKTLSRQSAVLVRLRVRPNSKLDELLGYWDRGVQVKDLRPLLEALTRRPDGGTISLLYLLPPFARERLYKFPLPLQPGQSAGDCHWSTMNFFNKTPDDRFADMNYIRACLDTNFYRVARPTLYGDLVFLVEYPQVAVHSAVHIAGDIVFTKNGNNHMQPWMLMRLSDLVARYTTDKPPRLVVYRSNNL